MVAFSDEKLPMTRAQAALGYTSARDQASSVNEQHQTNENEGNAVEQTSEVDVKLGGSPAAAQPIDFSIDQEDSQLVEALKDLSRRTMNVLIGEQQKDDRSDYDEMDDPYTRKCVARRVFTLENDPCKQKT